MARQQPLSWGLSTIDTACPLDCPDSCSLAVTVERGRIVKIDGSHRHDVTAGFICGKVRRFAHRVYGEARLSYPAIRAGRKGDGVFTRVSWDEALDTIAQRIREIRAQWGGEAILPFSYGGSNGLVSQDTTDAELFRRLGASRLARTVCAAATGAAAAALYGKMPGVTYTDYVHAQLIVVWGANPSVSAIHLVPYIREARRRGAKLVVIDPRRTPLARTADLHLPVRPGTDVVVALAVHRYLFERGLADERFLAAHTRGAERLRERAHPWTFDRAGAEAGVAPEAIEEFAELYARRSPAVIRCGWGVERNRNGGNAALAILALPAVAGKFGVRGGGYSMSNSAAWGLEAEAWIDAPEPSTRIINMNQLGRALLEYDRPPVKLLFVYNCNPAATMPDQRRVLRGLARDDLFTVVFDQVMTDTARYADVVLPATTFLEAYDVAKAYGPISLQLVRPVIEPVGEARPNVEVFADLARRLGIAPRDGEEQEAEALLRITAAMPPEVAETLLADGRARPPIPAAPIQFVDVFPRTPDGKVNLFPEELDRSAPAGLYAYLPDPADADHPLALISPASEKTISSTLGELRERPAALQIHPADAAARGIEEGDTVRVFNHLGEVHCLAHLNPDLRPGTVSLPKGLWAKSTLNGATANALVPDTLTDLGGGACFNDARVEVERVISATFEGTAVAISVGSY
jgi:anaerobic selenocysteine-containing dehydrogenase